MHYNINDTEQRYYSDLQFLFDFKEEVFKLILEHLTGSTGEEGKTNLCDWFSAAGASNSMLFGKMAQFKSNVCLLDLTRPLRWVQFHYCTEKHHHNWVYKLVFLLCTCIMVQINMDIQYIFTADIYALSMHVPMFPRAMHCLKAGSVSMTRRQRLCSSLMLGQPLFQFL